jgi:hypothetical protein
LHLFYSACGGFCVIEDYEGLAFRFEIRFRDKVDYGAVFGEDFCKGFF